jgi:hypothetical protein
MVVVPHRERMRTRSVHPRRRYSHPRGIRDLRRCVRIKNGPRTVRVPLALHFGMVSTCRLEVGTEHWPESLLGEASANPFV